MNFAHALAVVESVKTRVAHTFLTRVLFRSMSFVPRDVTTLFLMTMRRKIGMSNFGLFYTGLVVGAFIGLVVFSLLSANGDDDWDDWEGDDE